MKNFLSQLVTAFLVLFIVTSSITPKAVGQSNLSCPSNITVSNDPGSCSAVVNYSLPTTTEPCVVSSLGLGDVAFTGYLCDGADQYSFVILVDIAAGTSISFTDRGWRAVGGFRDGEEDIVTWTANSALPAGTEVMIDKLSASVGNVAATTGNPLTFSDQGDQIFAYKGSPPVAGDESNFLAAIQMNGEWDDNAGSVRTSAQPSVFTDGETSISIAPEKDNAVYTCIITTGTPTELGMAINDKLNWESTNNPNNLNVLPSCGFSVLCTKGLKLIGGLESGDAFPVGTTTVTYQATFGDGSTENCSFTVTVEGDLSLSNLLSAYTMIAKKEVKLKHSTVSGGGVGVKDAGKKAKIDGGSIVSSFVKADNIEIKGGSQVALTIFDRANVSLPSFRNNPHNSNNDITVSNGNTVTLSGSNYGKIEVKDNATLIFNKAEVFIKELKTKNGAKINFTRSTELIIKKKFDLDENNEFNQSQQSVMVFIDGDAKIKGGTHFYGNIYAKKKIKVEGAQSNNPTQMNGLFISDDKIDSKEYVNWNGNEECNLVPGGNSNLAIIRENSSAPNLDRELVSSVELVKTVPIQDFTAFPNPFSSTTTIQFNLPQPGQVTLEVFNIQGQRVRVLKNGKLEAGNHTQNWDGTAKGGQALNKGIYVIRLKTGDTILTKKLSLMR